MKRRVNQSETDNWVRIGSSSRLAEPGKNGSSSVAGVDSGDELHMTRTKCMHFYGIFNAFWWSKFWTTLSELIWLNKDQRLRTRYSADLKEFGWSKFDLDSAHVKYGVWTRSYYIFVLASFAIRCDFQRFSLDFRVFRESKKFIYRSGNVRLGEDLRGQLLIEPYLI